MNEAKYRFRISVPVIPFKGGFGHGQSSEYVAWIMWGVSPLWSVQLDYMCSYYEANMDSHYEAK